VGSVDGSGGSTDFMLFAMRDALCAMNLVFLKPELTGRVITRAARHREVARYILSKAW